MPDIDIPIKRIMQIRPEDYVEFVVPGCRKELITELNPEKVPKKESRMDKLMLINSPNERFILNIEPQAYYDRTMPARMLRYRADTWEYTLHQNMGTPSIKQVVIYFFKKDDNNEYFLTDKWGDEDTLKYSFKPIRIWETKKAFVIEKKLMGLYPLMPLMDREAGETDEDIIKKTFNTIGTVEDSVLRSDLLAGASIFGEYSIASNIVKKYIRRELVMNSPLFNEWMEEDRKNAELKATRKLIFDLLIEKFSFVPNSIRETLNILNDISILEELHRKIIRINTLEEFKALLEKAIKIST